MEGRGSGLRVGLSLSAKLGGPEQRKVIVVNHWSHNVVHLVFEVTVGWCLVELTMQAVVVSASHHDSSLSRVACDRKVTARCPAWCSRS